MKNEKLKISGIVLVIIVIFTGSLYAANMQMVVGDLSNPRMDLRYSDPNSYSYSLKTFSSYEEFTRFLNNCSSDWSDDHELRALPNIVFTKSSVVSIGMDAGVVSVDFSKTNIQVEGVDEPDMVKTDGTYLYIVSGQKVFIIKAWPAPNATIVSIISINCSISNIFINGDRLVIFGDSYSYFVCENEGQEVVSPRYNSPNTCIKVYDLTDRSQPELKKDIVVGGNYFNARMIGDYVYIITTQYSYNIYHRYDGNDTFVPLISVNGAVKKIPLSDIYCIDSPSGSYTLTHVVSVNVTDDSEDVVDKIFTLGSSQTMYVSKNNIYITYEVNHYYDYNLMQQAINEVVYSLLPDKLKQDIDCARGFDMSDYNKRQVVEWILEGYYNTLDEQNRTALQQEINNRMHRTIIHKISVSDGKIEYQCNGSVPGRVLNQFSMDEYNGFFRIATTIGYVTGYDDSAHNNIYILGENLNRVSAIEDIAPGEQIHSARFIGGRAYLVTFKKIDPFFTIDLSDPYNPKILGELKIPGYSDYLHPYDENHIIGIGKDTAEPQEGWDNKNFAWYQGLKIALFDVSDFENPKEVAKIVIGDRGTDSPVLYDHKAFLFDLEKELLVIPVSLYEIPQETKEQHQNYTGNIYGEFTFQGAYVYRLSLDNGFEFKGRITHQSQEEMQQISDYWYWGSSNTDITRTLYIGDVLYTISGSMVKMNSLEDLSEINSINLI